MPEPIYSELDTPGPPPPSRRRPRDLSISEAESRYSDIDSYAVKPSSPKQVHHHSKDDFPPPPPDFYDSQSNYEAIYGDRPPRPPRPSEPQQPVIYAKPFRPQGSIRIIRDDPQPPPSPTEPPPLPPKQYTSVFYPATPSMKPAEAKPKDPACNFVGLTDERDLKPRDPILLQQYALNNPVLPDPVFNYEKIYGLKKENIDLFLKCRDVAMILFYNPDDLGRRTGLQKRYADAASITSRYNHAYATVNCQTEKELCHSYNITKTPVFSVFTLKNLVGSFRDSTIEPETLKRYVENVPLVKRR